MINLTPIEPIRTETGALAVLVDRLGEEAAQPVPLADESSALTSFDVVLNSLSISLAADLSLGSIFGSSGSLEDQGFYYDAMAYTDQYAERQGADQIVLATRWGVGIRVLLRVSKISTETTLNFGLVGAAVELGQAQAQYQISGIGIGVDGLSMVLEELSGTGDFTYETYLKLNGIVVPRLAEYIRENKALLRPQPVAVALAQPVDPLASARTVYYSMVAIAGRRTLGETLRQAPALFSRIAIRDTYVQVADSAELDETPSREAELEAEEWLRVSSARNSGTFW